MSIVRCQDIRGCAMKTGKRKRFVEESSVQNERARTEMQTLLRALHSYPEQFVRDPDVSFAEYYRNLIQTK